VNKYEGILIRRGISHFTVGKGKRIGKAHHAVLFNVHFGFCCNAAKVCFFFRLSAILVSEYRFFPCTELYLQGFSHALSGQLVLGNHAHQPVSTKSISVVTWLKTAFDEQTQFVKFFLE
jgi:hypothetical protein